VVWTSFINLAKTKQSNWKYRVWVMFWSFFSKNSRVFNRYRNISYCRNHNPEGHSFYKFFTVLRNYNDLQQKILDCMFRMYICRPDPGDDHLQNWYGYIDPNWGFQTLLYIRMELKARRIEIPNQFSRIYKK